MKAALTLAIVAALAQIVSAQRTTAAAQIARPVVVGHPMRVRTAGLQTRTRGRPVVILESGLLQGVETWNPIFDRIAALAPVIAYDRRGIGQSEFDGEAQTLAHMTASLHALLSELKTAPPYVLVGHSYGGILIRAFARDYPQEVAGLVYVDAPDTDLTPGDLAQISPEALAQTTSELDRLPGDLPAGMKAEIDNMRRLVSNCLVQLNQVRPPSTIPAAVLVAAGKVDNPNDPTPRTIREGRLRIAMRHELEWALAGPDGLFIVARRGGHNLHQDNPDLTVQAIQYILGAIASTSK